ncbi:MAG: helix-turn-helix transcriptional regulator [Spirulina sp.]
MKRKKETLTLSIPPGTKTQLEEVARREKVFWGENPSISGLLVAIARGEIETGKPFSFSPAQIHALDRAVKVLTDAGRMNEAKTIIELLVERGQLEAPLRQKLLKAITHETEAWRRVIDMHIEREEPFHLIYSKNPQEQEEFNVRFGCIQFIEKRFYLEAWCEEMTEDEPIPELQHNRCFRLDKILNVLRHDGIWRKEGLGTIEVYLHFYGRMAEVYESKEEDIDDKVEGEGKDKIRKVVKKTSNPFWLVREVMRYGKNCEIVSPKEVRDRLKKDLKKMCEQYGLTVSES